MLITDVYKTYRINTGLQEHMLRVAAVAHHICEHATAAVDTPHIVSGCLIHDVGNLIKMKTGDFPELFEPEGVAYWANVKEEMIAQYGNDEHKAAIRMVTDMKVSAETYRYFIAIGGEANDRVHAEGSLGEKIATYSDMRVAPRGIVSLTERMNDIRDRYIGRAHSGFAPESIDAREEKLSEMETEIFAHNTLKPDDITNEAVESALNKLRNWELI